MDFLSVYSIHDLAVILHPFLTTQDELRLDSTCKSARAVHRAAIYPLFTTLDMDLTAQYSENKTSYYSFVHKIAPYVESLYATNNGRTLPLLPLQKLPRLRNVFYTVPICVDVTFRVLHAYTSRMWESVENMIVDRAENDQHPLESISVFPGDIVLLRTELGTGRVLNEKWLHDRNEATHLLFYRRFGYADIYVPASLSINMYLPPLLVPATTVPQSIRFWTWAGEDSLGKMVLDLQDI